MESQLAMEMVLKEAQCVICERKHGEDGAELISIQTGECVVPICKWPCMEACASYVFIKCRSCGRVGSIPKYQAPVVLGQHTFIMFVPSCRDCEVKS